jgi:hypothetical protein
VGSFWTIWGVSAYEEGLLLMGRTDFEIIFKSFWKLLKNFLVKKEQTAP